MTPKPKNEFHLPDKEDRDRLAGKSAGYIIGWNKVKHGKKRRAE